MSKSIPAQNILILNHPLVKIHQTDDQYILKIRMKTGDWLICEPYKSDLRGMIQALSLAQDCLAGKIIPVSIIQDSAPYPMPEPIHISPPKASHQGV